MSEIRNLAVRTHNQAYEEVESGANPAHAVELAATALNLWRKVGDSKNLVIGCWLYSRALAKFGAPKLALAVTKESLEHIQAMDAPEDWLTASALEGYARALKAVGAPEAEVALQTALRAIDGIEDEADRKLIAGQIADLL